MADSCNVIPFRSPLDVHARAKEAAEATNPWYLREKWDRLYPGWNLKPVGLKVVSQKLSHGMIVRTLK